MRKKDYIITIGSANMDVAGYSHGVLNYADSNPGKIKFTPGGVGVIFHRILPCWELSPGYSP
jgi:pseudouridine kinase